MLQDDMFDVILKHSLIDLAAEKEAEAKNILDELQNAPDGPIPPQVLDKKIRRIISLHKKRQNFRPLTILQKVAIFIITLLITGTATTMIARANGINLWAYLFGLDDKYTNMQLTKNMEDEFWGKLDDSWNYAYFPRYIPNGYTINEISCASAQCAVIFTGGGSELRIWQHKIETAPSIKANTENSKYITLRDFKDKALFTENENEKLLFFHDDKFSIKIVSDSLSEQEMIRIADNLKIIIKQ